MDRLRPSLRSLLLRKIDPSKSATESNVRIASLLPRCFTTAGLTISGADSNAPYVPLEEPDKPIEDFDPLQQTLQERRFLSVDDNMSCYRFRYPTRTFKSLTHIIKAFIGGSYVDTASYWRHVQEEAARFDKNPNATDDAPLFEEALYKEDADIERLSMKELQNLLNEE